MSAPRVSIEVARGKGEDRSRFAVVLSGERGHGGAYYWTPAEAEAIFQALGEVLEPLGGDEKETVLDFRR